MGDAGETPEAGDAPEASETPKAADATGGGPGDLREGEWVEDISDTVAPSVGPHSKVVHHAPSDEKPPDMDAMGLDKRREVVGGSYGPGFAKQATLYGGVLVVIAALVIGFVLLAGELDQPPETTSDEAAWSQPDAPQTPVSPLE